MLISYPLHFHTRAQAKSGTRSHWSSTYHPASGSAVASAVAIPPEFDGPGTGYSPEDFYALALLNCFVATFKVIAEKSNLAFEELVCEGELTIDRDEKGVPWMSSFHLKGFLQGVADEARALRLLEKTSGMCMILNSVKTVKTYEWKVEKLQVPPEAIPSS